MPMSTHAFLGREVVAYPQQLNAVSKLAAGVKRKWHPYHLLHLALRKVPLTFY